MYDVKAHLKYAKRFKKLLNSLSTNDSKKLKLFLQSTPKGNKTSHTTCKKIKNNYQFDVPGAKGNRVIYRVFDDSKTVLLLFAGNHEDAKSFIKNL